MGLIGEDVSLPKTVSGANVGLLIGLKSLKLDPILVCTLPSGVGLYLCPFDYVMGFRYTFGGPHALFSRKNAESGSAANMIMTSVDTSCRSWTSSSQSLCTVASPAPGTTGRLLMTTAQPRTTRSLFGITLTFKYNSGCRPECKSKGK